MPGRRRQRRRAAISISWLATMLSPAPAAASTWPLKPMIFDIPSVDASGMPVPVMPPLLAEMTNAWFSMARARLAMSLGVSSGLPTSLVECKITSAPRNAMARVISG